MRVVKSQNEFKTKLVTLNNGWCHVTRTFRNSTISWNIEAGGPFGVLHAEIFSLARFQCLAALACIIIIIIIIIWFVKRFCRRVMPAPGCSADGGCRHRFYTLGALTFEFLEICQFIWSNRIFRFFLLPFPFDPHGQIAKRIWNDGCGFKPRVVSCDSIISEIENLVKYWSWLAVRRLKWSNFVAGAISMPCGAHVYYYNMTRKAVLCLFNPYNK